MHLDRRIFARAGKARNDLILTVGLGGLAGLLVVLQALILSRIIDQVFLGGRSLADVRFLLLSLVAVGLGRACVSWAADVFAQRVAGRVKMDLRCALTRHLLTLGPTYLRGERTGELTNTFISGVESLDAYLSQYLPRLAMAAILPLLVLGFVLPNDPLSGLILIVTAPVIPVFIVLIGNLARERTRRQWLLLGRMSAHFLDVLQGLPTLKMLGRSRDEEANIRTTSEKFHHATMGLLRVAFLSALVLEIAATIGTALVAVGVGLRLLHGRLGFDQALFVLILAPEFYRPLRSLGSAFHAGLPGVEAARRIFAVLETPPTRPAHQLGTGAASPVPSHPMDIDFSEVRFEYEPGRPVLDGVSFRAPAGSKVALVGPTGAGKSTVGHLLLRFAEPTSGSIRVGGTPLSDLDPFVWRRRVAWVPQRPHLFHGTAGENILLGRREATREEVIEAARLAHAHDFITALPQGYDTPLGEGGARLSGGEAQRIALARAFLKDAPLLLLDEPTSQLDPESEASVQEAIRRLTKGRTVLLIAHRVGTVVDSDTIVLLAEGKVIEQGSHTRLLEEGRLYPRLVEAYGDAP